MHSALHRPLPTPFTAASLQLPGSVGSASTLWVLCASAIPPTCSWPCHLSPDNGSCHMMGLLVPYTVGQLIFLHHQFMWIPVKNIVPYRIRKKIPHMAFRTLMNRSVWISWSDFSTPLSTHLMLWNQLTTSVSLKSHMLAQPMLGTLSLHWSLCKINHLSSPSPPSSLHTWLVLAFAFLLTHS